jgi:glucokinase
MPPACSIRAEPVNDHAPMTTLTAAPPGPAGGDGFPWLVADVGGTNARFALVDAGSAALREVRTFACADFASLQDAACSYLSQVAPGQRPGLAAFALATVIDGDVLRMTVSVRRRHL